MEQIFSAENVNRSVEELLQKNDSCGIDGIFVSQYAEYWKLNQEKILTMFLMIMLTGALTKLKKCLIYLAIQDNR